MLAAVTDAREPNLVLKRRSSRRGPRAPRLRDVRLHRLCELEDRDRRCGASVGGRILLCRRAIEPRKGFWTLPAGFLWNSERASRKAPRREAREEANAEAGAGNASRRLLDPPHRPGSGILPCPPSRTTRHPGPKASKSRCSTGKRSRGRSSLSPRCAGRSTTIARPETRRALPLSPTRREPTS